MFCFHRHMGPKGFFIVPLVAVILILSGANWAWWMLIPALMWGIPALVRRAAVEFGDGEPGRKRKDRSGYDDYYAGDGDDTKPKRRLVRTPDGEVLVALEDPLTGELVLETDTLAGDPLSDDQRPGFRMI